MRTSFIGLGLSLFTFILCSCEKTEETYLLGTRNVSRSWGTATLIDHLDGVYSPSVAIDAAGNAVAVWSKKDSSGHLSVYAARMVCGVWSPPQLLENSDYEISSPHVAINPSGVAVAVWGASSQAGNFVYANRMTTDGHWGTAQQIDSDGEDNSYIQIAIDAAGNALAIWSLGDTIACNTMNADGVWGTHVNVLPSLTQIHDLRLAMNAAGEAIVAWSQSQGGTYKVRACSVSGGVWYPPQSLENLVGNFYVHDAAIDDLGNGIVVFGNSDQIYACRRTGGSWESPVALNDPAKPAYCSRVAMMGNGDAVVVFAQHDGVNGSVAARRLVSGIWQDLEWVENENGGDAGYPASVATDGKGNAVVVWKQNDGTGYSIWANEFTGGSWGTAWYIETSSNSPNLPFLAMSSDGTAVAVWLENNGSAYDLWANRYR